MHFLPRRVLIVHRPRSLASDSQGKFRRLGAKTSFAWWTLGIRPGGIARSFQLWLPKLPNKHAKCDAGSAFYWYNFLSYSWLKKKGRHSKNMALVLATSWMIHTIFFFNKINLIIKSKIHQIQCHYMSPSLQANGTPVVLSFYPRKSRLYCTCYNIQDVAVSPYLHQWSNTRGKKNEKIHGISYIF